ncbi:hypothetical protein YC2023_066909 [Brassica napus]
MMIHFKEGLSLPKRAVYRLRFLNIIYQSQLTGFHSLCPLSLKVLQGGDTWQAPIFSNLKPQV